MKETLLNKMNLIVEYDEKTEKVHIRNTFNDATVIVGNTFDGRGNLGIEIRNAQYIPTILEGKYEGFRIAKI